MPDALSITRSALHLAALALAVALLSAPSAFADVRRAVLKDGVDPTLTYDLERVRATLDRSTGTLTIRIRLHRPFPTAMDGSYWATSIGVSVNGSPSGGDCRSGSETVGATRLLIDASSPAPTPDVPEIQRASVRVAYRETPTPIGLTVAADRLSASVTVEDELLRGAELRCLSAMTTGRSTYDPRQPGGGPTMEGPIGAYFAGFSPRALLRRALRRCAVRHDVPRRLTACKRRARERFGFAPMSGRAALSRRA